VRGRRLAPVRVPSAGGSHRSHQGEIWADIQGLQEVTGVASRTHAMHDVYSERQEKLAGVERAFQRLDGQVGGVFMVDGKVVGLRSSRARRCMRTYMLSLSGATRWRRSSAARLRRLPKRNPLCGVSWRDSRSARRGPFPQWARGRIFEWKAMACWAQRWP